ncbi:MAG: NAD-dependent protein deacylase [Candidatus Bipolaricaulota bacterium]|nr:NAD-dependent protein deacylase [Candidatus Bipolaricaulota bacterium]
MRESVERLAQMLQEAHYAVALTGAGVSTDSGIPDFRSPTSGLWAQYNPMEVASLGGFRSNPARFYEFWRQRFAKLADAQPNITHRALAELEARGYLKCVITQNIDDLHRRAGSRRVLEVHGNYMRGLCLGCQRPYTIQEIFEKVERHRVPLCDDCNNLLKPDVVLFGELLTPDFDQALDEIAQSDLLVVLGSSLEVYPVAGLVPHAKSLGARLVIINRDETPYDRIAHLVIRSELQPVMTELRHALSL